MRITRVSVWAHELALAKAYRLSGGRQLFERLDCTTVRVDTDEGLSGWGEGCPWGATYLPAHGPGTRAGIETLAPSIIGRDPCALDAINRAMDSALPGHPYAKSPLDIACWDILGRSTGMPLWRLLGVGSAEPVLLSSSIGTATPEEMLADIAEAHAAGYRVHSAKVGGADPAMDVARIDAIEAGIEAGDSVTFDINRAWTPAVAIEVMNAVQAGGWFEQPCETIEQCRDVRTRTRQPILLDECLHDLGDHLRAWRLGACEGVKVKPNRVGGLTKARRVRDLGIALGWRMHIEDVGGTVLADTAAIHLAASTPAENRLASWLCHPHLAVDAFPGQGSRNEHGFATPPTGPGIGVLPDPDWLDEPCAVYGTRTG